MARSETGLALLLALIALALFSLIGLGLAINASTGMRISDNYEAEVVARHAALAGLNHARMFLGTQRFDDLLRGPDGQYDHAPSYIALARTYRFRNPMDLAVALRLNIEDPFPSVAGMPDDGVLNAGIQGGSAGLALIPLTGLPLADPGAGGRIRSRYFVKVTDNNGEPSEIGADPSDNPFTDGDGVIIIRSLGISTTVAETVGAQQRRNSIAVFEGRFRRRLTFAMDSPLVVQGQDLLPSASIMFEGDNFQIDGGPGNFGITTIDLNEQDSVTLPQRIVENLAAGQEVLIGGAGLVPSVRDATAAARGDKDKSLLLDSSYLARFVRRNAPRFAHVSLAGPQDWGNANAPDLGWLNPDVPPEAPGQRPRAMLVDGDLTISGNVRGGGLLIVTGRLTVTGALVYNGIILVIGSGESQLTGAESLIRGAVFSANLPVSGGSGAGGLPRLSLGGRTHLIYHKAAVNMGLSLIPPVQFGFREVTSSMDP